VERVTPNLPSSSHETTSADAMLRRIDAGRVWFWIDERGERVHLTGANPPSFGVARIGPVYTPGHLRRRGYASAAVARVSRQIVAHGARACLFTDQANPTSNQIYQSLGYRPVVDMVHLLVE
jgi:predicted GNAT family acetyltransferase